MASLRNTWGRLRSEYGAELIEMAIVMPLLLMLVAGIFDFGFAFRNWEVVTNAAREGARVGVLPAYTCAPGGAVTTRIDDYMAGAGITDTSAYSVQIAPSTINGFTSCSVTVLMFQQLSSLSVIGTFFGGSFTSVPLRGAAVMRTETQGP
jgi:Flp pilus assembly protein TadG